MESAVQEYRVLYTSSGIKKRKIFQDGKLIIKKQSNNDAYTVILLNEEGKDVKRSTEKKIDHLKQIGEECVFGNNHSI